VVADAGGICAGIDGAAVSVAEGDRIARAVGAAGTVAVAGCGGADVADGDEGGSRE